jgi:hypothetical protein
MAAPTLKLIAVKLHCSAAEGTRNGTAAGSSTVKLR